MFFVEYISLRKMRCLETNYYEILHQNELFYILLQKIAVTNSFSEEMLEGSVKSNGYTNMMEL